VLGLFGGVYLGWALGANDAANVFGTAVGSKMIQFKTAAMCCSVFTKLSKHTKVKTFTLHGGVQQDEQIKKLQEGIDILITTPGRMFDLIN